LLWLWIPAACALLFTGVARKLAVSHNLIDLPNSRSSHMVPTPRGGGVAIVAAMLPALLWSGACGSLEITAVAAVVLGGAAVALVGFLDDRRGLSARIRIAVHVTSIALLLIGTSSLGKLAVPGVPDMTILQFVTALLALTWLLNLFNFMDGIDGIASAEACYFGLGLAITLRATDHAGQPVGLSLALAGAALGFLFWNWPPAKIFLGDVGSGFLGFIVGALALVAHLSAGLTLWAPVILVAVFVADATVTLLRRMLQGERWHQAHRTHLYQRLSRKLGGHLPVTIGVLFINFGWLLPLAVAASRRPALGGLFAAVAYVPLLAATLLGGAGKVAPNGGSQQVEKRRQ
jgi:Fuc2NAc and GlcNAc transferase